MATLYEQIIFRIIVSMWIIAIASFLLEVCSDIFDWDKLTIMFYAIKQILFKVSLICSICFLASCMVYHILFAFI